MTIVLGNAPGHRAVLFGLGANPATIAASYGASAVAPHAATSRWTYTVPAAKRGLITILEASVVRDVAPTTAGLANAYIQLTPSGGAATFLLLASNAGGSVNDGRALALGCQLWLEAGDKLEALTSDASTGGSHQFVLTLAATEFTA